MKLSVDDVQVMNLIGDVKGKVAVMVDDMIDTAGRDSSHVPRIFGVTQFCSEMLVYKICWTQDLNERVDSYLECLTQVLLQTAQHFYMQKELERCMLAAHMQFSGLFCNAKLNLSW
jgi:hypothetical protein